MVPGTWIADTVPSLARLPECLQWWRKGALKHLDYQTEVWMKYWNFLKANVNAGKAPDCFGRQLIEKAQQGKGLTELENAFLAGCKSANKLDMMFPLHFFLEINLNSL